MAEYRLEIYYGFGLLCLASWFAFNLWILRDYFFPCWFTPIYTQKGLSKQKLDLKKQEILMRNRISVSFQIPALIVASPDIVRKVILSTLNKLRIVFRIYQHRSDNYEFQLIFPLIMSQNVICPTIVIRFILKTI